MRGSPAWNWAGFMVVHANPLQGSYDPATQRWTIARIGAGEQATMLLTVKVLAPENHESSHP